MTYFYTLTATASDECHPSLLHIEIVTAGLAGFQGVTCDMAADVDKQLQCHFGAPLPDQRPLDVVVAAHNGALSTSLLLAL